MLLYLNLMGFSKIQLTLVLIFFIHSLMFAQPNLMFKQFTCSLIKCENFSVGSSEFYVRLLLLISLQKVNQSYFIPKQFSYYYSLTKCESFVWLFQNCARVAYIKYVYFLMPKENFIKIRTKFMTRHILISHMIMIK